MQQAEAKKVQEVNETEKTSGEASIEINVEVDAIQQIEIGDDYGEPAANNREVSLGEMVSKR